MGKFSRGLRFVLDAPMVPGGVEPKAAPARSGVDYPTDWARRGPARAARRAIQDGVLAPAIVAVTRPEVHGMDRLSGLDQDRPVVFAANHHSHADTPLLLHTLPEPWRSELFVAAAADYFFPNQVAAAASALVLNAIPIDRSRISRRSADDAARLIEDGWSMLIYPEGGRSPDGYSQPFRGGAAYLSIRCEVPVVPIHVEGTDRIWPKGQRLPKPGRATVTFGEPLVAEVGEDSRKLAARLEAAVAALADEQATDWYQARRRFHARTSPPLTGPETVSWRRQWARTEPAPDAGTTRRWPPR